MALFIRGLPLPIKSPSNLSGDKYMDTQTILTLIGRHVLTTLGGWLVSHGYLQERIGQAGEGFPYYREEAA
jgi:hypothetical protein